MFEELDKLLEKKNQRLVCSPTGGGKDKFITDIYHEVSTALDPTSIDKLKRKYGKHDQLFALLSLYGSIRLYCDTLSENSGYYICHPDEWGELNTEFNFWIDQLSEKERVQFIPDWVDETIVIGEVPNSGNYFLYPYKGRNKGMIFEFQHDGFIFLKLADSINDFINFLSSPSNTLLKNLSFYTRYSDKTSDIQWVATEFI